MKVLVLGADGFIGRSVRKVLEQKHEVIAATRNNDGPHADLLSKDSVLRLLKETQPMIIVNSAGIVDNSEAAQQNIIFSTNLLEAAYESGLNFANIIICGSAAVYGVVDEVDIPVSEDAPLNPISEYGLSKLKEEQKALELASEYDLPVVVTRIFNPIGIGMHARFLIPQLIKQVHEIQSSKRSSIEVSRLNSKRDYVNVKDVAEAIKILLENNPKQTIYNIGSGKSSSNRELIELIISKSKLSHRPNIIETSHEDEPLLAIQADINRINTELGWSPTHPIEETIKEIIYAARQ